jgi:hypothetical protein
MARECPVPRAGARQARAPSEVIDPKVGLGYLIGYTCTTCCMGRGRALDIARSVARVSDCDGAAAVLPGPFRSRSGLHLIIGSTASDS